MKFCKLTFWVFLGILTLLFNSIPSKGQNKTKLCKPKGETKLFVKKQVSGKYLTEIGTGKKMVARYKAGPWENCSAPIQWMGGTILIEISNPESIKVGKIYELPNQNIKVIAQIEQDLGINYNRFEGVNLTDSLPDSYYSEINGKIIFHKINNEYVSLSTFLFDTSEKSFNKLNILLNRKNLVFTIKGKNEPTGFNEGVLFLDQNKTKEIEAKIPGYPGGDKKLQEDIKINIKYPEVALRNGIEGLVIIETVLNKNGELENFKVLKTPGGYLEDEAIRVLKLLKGWKPISKSGSPSDKKFVVPVYFKRPI